MACPSPINSVLAAVIACSVFMAPSLAPVPENVAAAQGDLSAGPDQAANALFVEALQDIAAAGETTDPEARVILLRRAQANLDRIVDQHPGSQLAVQLMTGQRIGTFDPRAFAQRIAVVEDDWRCVQFHDACALFADALVTVEEISDIAFRSEALAVVSIGQAAAGFVHPPRQSVAEASLAVAFRHDWLGIRAEQLLTRVATAQAAVGMVDGARRTFAEAVASVGDISGADMLGRHLAAIVDAQVAAGFLADALDAVSVLGTEACLYRADALAAIGAGYVRAGQMDRAQQIFADALASASDGRCRQRPDRTEALVAIARAQAAVGFIDEAGQTFADAIAAANEPLALTYGRGWALAEIARAQAAAGLIDDASATLAAASAAAEDPYEQFTYSEGLAGVAIAQSAVGLFADAIATAGRIPSESVRIFAFTAIAERQAAAGLTDEARRTFAETVAVAADLPSDDFRTEHLAVVAIGQAVAGFPGDGMATVDQITGDTLFGARAETLAAIGVAEAASGALSRSRHAFSAAVSAARAMEGTIGRNEALMGVAEAQARAALASMPAGEAEAALPPFSPGCRDSMVRLCAYFSD